ncbi:DUF4296 domain-containing protein [Flavobacterium selenitireducens]|uniref:DUF4296 domain-containing protein n=1 Tax=Flavobacterium selenitireducens TaxID=2722704 RepID=UPI00168B0C7E|nr:DUF4296 domain-containing protein [Flavobacterium selenitireducens]MBD3581971.1 DUF4296 domain-containing protein [Flavobacterium selenitireducens]
MRKIVTIALVYLLAACGNSVEKPDKLVAEDKMVDIFYDLALLEAIKAHKPNLIQRSKDPNQYIYKKYGIDSLQFAQSNRYYASDIRRYKRMYGRVGKRLEGNKKTLDSIVAKKTGQPGVESIVK